MARFPEIPSLCFWGPPTTTTTTTTLISWLCLELEQIRDHFYSGDPPMSVGKSGLGFALTQSIAKI